MIDRVAALSLLGCLVCGAVLFRELQDEPAAEVVVATAPRAAPAAAAPAARPASVAVETLVAAALERPLFSANRRPPDRPKGDAPSAPELPDLRLTGIVIQPDRHLAIFASPGSKPLSRAEGETVNDWRIERIAANEVALSGPTGTLTLAPKPDPNIVRTPPTPAQPARPVAVAVPTPPGGVRPPGAPPMPPQPATAPRIPPAAFRPPPPSPPAPGRPSGAFPLPGRTP